MVFSGFRGREEQKAQEGGGLLSQTVIKLFRLDRLLSGRGGGGGGVWGFFDCIYGGGKGRGLGEGRGGGGGEGGGGGGGGGGGL